MSKDSIWCLLLKPLEGVRTSYNIFVMKLITASWFTSKVYCAADQVAFSFSDLQLLRKTLRRSCETSDSNKCMTSSIYHQPSDWQVIHSLVWLTILTPISRHTKENIQINFHILLKPLEKCTKYKDTSYECPEYCVRLRVYYSCFQDFQSKTFYIFSYLLHFHIKMCTP